MDTGGRVQPSARITGPLKCSAPGAQRLIYVVAGLHQRLIPNWGPGRAPSCRECAALPFSVIFISVSISVTLAWIAFLARGQARLMRVVPAASQPDAGPAVRHPVVRSWRNEGRPPTQARRRWSVLSFGGVL
jgi:hypothetical protein